MPANLTFSGEQALSGLSTLLNWGSICMCHIRFRKAWRVQGHSVDELPFQALGGVYGSWLGFILVCLVLIAQFYVAVCESSFFRPSCTVPVRTHAVAVQGRSEAPLPTRAKRPRPSSCPTSWAR